MVRKGVSAETMRHVKAILKKRRLIGRQKPYEKNKAAQKFFLKLKSADHRKKDSESHRWLDTAAGFKVRTLPTKTGEVIIKPPEWNTAINTIKHIQCGVRLINKNKHAKFILLMPHAKAIGQFVVMKKTYFPSLFEMIGDGEEMPPTKRGLTYLSRIARTTGKSNEEILRTLDVAHDSLQRSAQAMLKRNGNKGFSRGTYEARNILVLGIKNGKVLFLPLMDLR